LRHNHLALLALSSLVGLACGGLAGCGGPGTTATSASSSAATATKSPTDAGGAPPSSAAETSSVLGSKAPASDSTKNSESGNGAASSTDVETSAAAGHARTLKLAAESLAKLDFDSAEKQFDSLEKQLASLSEADQKQFNQLKEKLEDERQAHEDQLREKHLTVAKQAVQDGKLDDATTAIETLLAAAPTTEQGTIARELQATIERHRTVRRRLRVGMDQLASKERGSVKKAAEILWEEQDVALPLLLESLKSENTVLVSNTLELLRKFNQPERTLPAMISILGRPQQADVWPIAIKELAKVQSPGAGKPLLELALASTDPAVAVPVLSALSGASDPPPETLVALLPQIYKDSPALASSLSAAYRSITVNHQHDVLTRRGVDVEVTETQDRQLNGLADRLQSIIKSADKQPDAAWGAQRLAIAMRLMSAETLPGLKVVRATADAPESPATAVVDGVWDSVDVKTMWQHPYKRLTTIVLDLGTERTVTGIRIWNYNEQSGAHRGWKDVEIYVSSDPSPTVPAAIGVVPPAPGIAGTPDYGAILQVPFTKGRFVKLQLLSVWREDGIAGLSEVQILGY